jgi:hypothetical protein
MSRPLRLNCQSRIGNRETLELGRRVATVERMTIQRMENVGIVVDDLAAATAFFVELGLNLLGEGPVGDELRPAANRLASVSGRPGAGSSNGTPAQTLSAPPEAGLEINYLAPW